MYSNKTFLGLIPARGGSKGIPRKNLIDIGGKPLLAWTLAAASASQCLDRVIISSEDSEIIETARRLGCDVPFTRPAELAQDQTPGIEPVLHALGELPGFDYLVLLQPTSPLRSSQDIDAAIAACVDRGAPSCVSVTEANENPHWMFQLTAERRLVRLVEDSNFVRRQDLPVTYLVNGAVYVASREFLLSKRTFIAEETVGYVMPRERSADLDTAADQQWIEFLIRERGSRQVV